MPEHRRLQNGGGYGPWHVLDPESRPYWYSSGRGLCGASFYVSAYRKVQSGEPKPGEKVCPKCKRLNTEPTDPSPE